MSAWGDMRRRSSGKMKRTEDKFKNLEVIKNEFKDNKIVWWKNYDGEDIEEITQDVADEINHIRWGNQYAKTSDFRNFEDYYVIDHFELL